MFFNNHFYSMCCMCSTNSVLYYHNDYIFFRMYWNWIYMSVLFTSHLLWWILNYFISLNYSFPFFFSFIFFSLFCSSIGVTKKMVEWKYCSKWQINYLYLLIHTYKYVYVRVTYFSSIHCIHSKFNDFFLSIVGEIS